MSATKKLRLAASRLDPNKDQGRREKVLESATGSWSPQALVINIGVPQDSLEGWCPQSSKTQKAKKKGRKETKIIIAPQGYYSSPFILTGEWGKALFLFVLVFGLTRTFLFSAWTCRALDVCTS